MDYRSGRELLGLCEQEKSPISVLMKMRETACGTLTIDEAEKKVEKVLSIMKRAVKSSIKYNRYIIGFII